MRCAAVLHCGLPLGTPQLRLAQAVDGPLSALLDALQTRPHVRLGLHLGGHVLDFLLRHRSERLVQLAGLSQSGQIELVGGGYYDPVLCALPARSAQAQLARTHRFFSDQLRLDLSGVWLPEQVFEPSVISLLEAAGYRYVLCPTDPIDAAGCDTSGLSAPLRLEQGGVSILGLACERGDEAQLVQSLGAWSEQAQAGRSLLVWSDDLLALSSDPQAFPKGAQIERFIADLDAAPSLQFVLPKTLIESEPGPLVYPGLGSHRAMGTWSLPVEAGRRRARILESAAKKGGHQGLNLVAGGRWSSFLARYSEAGAMYSRALQLAERVERAQLPTYWRERMWAGILQAQGHEAFQHGDRSGIYNPVLRQAVHGRLRDIEEYLDYLESAATADPKALNGIRHERRQLLPDGTQGITLKGTRGRWTFCPSAGGALVGIEVSGLPWDVAHTMGRYPEHYDDLSDLSGPRWSLTERFVNRSEDVFSSNFIGDFSGCEYAAEVRDDELELSTSGPVGAAHDVVINKRYQATQSGAEMTMSLTIETPAHHAVRGYLVETLQVSLPPGEGSKIRVGDQVRDWDEPVRDEAASVQWASPSARLQFSVIFPGRVELITQPVHTEHRDRGALRSTLQGIELMALIPIQLGSGQRWSGDFVFRATRR